MSFVSGAITYGPGEGRVIPVPGHPITYKATAEGTEGAYSLLEVVVPSNGPDQLDGVVYHSARPVGQ